MNKFSLLSTVAASLLLTAAVASAQQVQQKMPERVPAPQQSAPAEKIAPPMNAGERKTPETTGQETKELKASDDAKSVTTRQGQKSDSDKVQIKEKNGSESKSGAGLKSESKGSADVKVKDADSAAGASQKSTESLKEKSATSGQGAASGSAKLSSEQRTKVTTIIKKQKVERVSPATLNISIRVGERVPSRVHLYPVPVEVVEVYPEWRGYLFILVGDQIVIISPDRHEIVAVLSA